MTEPKGPPPQPKNFQALGEPVPPERLAKLGSPAAHVGKPEPPSVTKAPSRGGERVNLHDRGSIERFYPRDVFERDAARNADAKVTVLRGVRILSAPDAEGSFEIARVSKAVTGSHPESDSRFLPPYATADSAALVDAGGYDAAVQKSGADSDKGRDYKAFIDAIVRSAENAVFQRPIGRNDDRLKGFHGG